MFALNISTLAASAKIVRYTVKNKGTVDCSVRFQMSKELAERVWAFFGVSNGEALYFISSEVLSQGYGWYEVVSRVGHDRIDTALDGFRHILMALSGIGNAKAAQACRTAARIHLVPKLVKPEPVAKQKYTVLVKPVRVQGHKKLVAVCRKVSAQENRAREEMKELAALLARATAEQNLAAKVASFNNRFHRAA